MGEGRQSNNSVSMSKIRRERREEDQRQGAGAAGAFMRVCEGHGPLARQPLYVAPAGHGNTLVEGCHLGLRERQERIRTSSLPGSQVLTAGHIMAYPGELLWTGGAPVALR